MIYDASINKAVSINKTSIQWCHHANVNTDQAICYKRAAKTLGIRIRIGAPNSSGIPRYMDGVYTEPLSLERSRAFTDQYFTELHKWNNDPDKKRSDWFR